MIPLKLSFYLAAAAPLQIVCAGIYFVATHFFPQYALLRAVLPVAYLALTYLQWLGVAFWLSMRKQKFPVPILMHLPHLLSFLPLVRHILLAADQRPIDSTGLNLAMVHSVVTHSFSLVAAWLWQVRAAFAGGSGLGKYRVAIALYALTALTTLIVYAGLDLSFSRSGFPFGVGLVQLLLYTAVTIALLLREKIRHLLPTVAVTAFAIVNGLLLFDEARSDIAVELALSAVSITQIFSLYVFLVFSASVSAAKH